MPITSTIAILPMHNGRGVRDFTHLLAGRMLRLNILSAWKSRAWCRPKTQTWQSQGIVWRLPKANEVERVTLWRWIQCPNHWYWGRRHINRLHHVLNHHNSRFNHHNFGLSHSRLIFHAPKDHQALHNQMTFLIPDDSWTSTNDTMLMA